jgi:cell division protein FtsB
MIDIWEKIVNGAAQKQPEQGITGRIGAAIYRVRRRIASGLVVVLAVFLGYYVVFGRNGINSYEQKRVEDRQLDRQIDALQQENNRLKDHVTRLKNDPNSIEYEAREKLHYARPGEVIYTLNNQPQPANSKSSAPAPTGDTR